MEPATPPPLPSYELSLCQGCQAYAPTKQVLFVRHIGAIILMFNQRIGGQFCRNCVNEHFAQTTLVTSFLGWWGMFSVFITPFCLLHNVIRYLLCLSLKSTDDVSARGTVLAFLTLIIAVGALSALGYILYRAVHQ